MILFAICYSIAFYFKSYFSVFDICFLSLRVCVCVFQLLFFCFNFRFCQLSVETISRENRVRIARLLVLNFVYCKFAWAVVVWVWCALAAQQMHSIFFLQKYSKWLKERKTNEKTKNNSKEKSEIFLIFLFYEHRQQHPKFTNDTVTNNKLIFFYLVCSLWMWYSHFCISFLSSQKQKIWRVKIKWK